MTATVERILPIITAENAPYWQSTRAHALKLPFCMVCERAFYPVQGRCPRCLGDRLDWRAVSGRARVYSWIVVHQVYDQSFAERVPYIVAVVELDEGPRLVTNIVNCPPEKVGCGVQVRAVYDDIDDEVALVYFEPEGAA